MSKFQAHKDAPDEVWLQIGYGDEGTHTWASHQVAEDDIEQAGPYVRADRLSGRVRVKPLEWKETTPGRYIAKAPFNLGQYVVDRHPGGKLIVWIAPGPDEDWQPVKSLDDAFAAAQADYEARILAALEPAPTPDAREKALREAAEVVKPTGDRPCDCDSCYCSNSGDAQAVADWDSSEANYRRILALIPAVGGGAPPIITYDDGTEIHLSGYAGGAAPGGEFSTLTLMRKRPGKPTEMRRYTSDGDWSSKGVPQRTTGGGDD